MRLKYGPYSPSRLETALCGHSFFRTYVDPQRKPRELSSESVPQARGSVVHEVFEVMTRRRIASLAAGESALVYADGELRQLVVDAMRRHPAAYEELDSILAMVRRYIDRPLKILTTDAEVELRFAVKHAAGAFVECSYDDPDAFARGRSDVFMISDDQKIGLIYDHKTQPNIEDADTFQMGVYAWLTSKIHPYLEEIHTVLHFAQMGIYSAPHVWTREALAQIEDAFLTRVAIIEGRESWEATPNKMCQYCPYISECPAVAEVFEIDEKSGKAKVKAKTPKILGSVEKAVQIAGVITVLDEFMSAAKKALKDHTDLYGPVAIPGMIYESRAKEAIDWDKVNKAYRLLAFEVFKRHNVDPADYMAFGATASKPIWLLGNAKLVEELSALFPRTVSRRFDGYKA
jgi:hypothetical protein